MLLPEHLRREQIHEAETRSVISISVYRAANSDVASKGVGAATGQVDALRNMLVA